LNALKALNIRDAEGLPSLRTTLRNCPAVLLLNAYGLGAQRLESKVAGLLARN